MKKNKKSMLLVMTMSMGMLAQSAKAAEGHDHPMMFSMGGMTMGSKPSVVHDKVLDGPIRSGVTVAPELPALSDEKIVKIRMDITHVEQEVGDGTKMMLWTFGGVVPGPVVRVKQGQTVQFTMANRTKETAAVTPPVPHSMDFHSSMVSPQDKFKSINPGQTIEYEWTANYPGVYLYHCGTPPVLKHIAQGMYGVAIVEPKEGWPTKADREYVVIQSEFYPGDTAGKNGLFITDMEKATKRQAKIVAFNGRALKHAKEPLKAKVGERVRLYVLNAGPSGTSSFHVVGTIFDRVYAEGVPTNLTRGGQQTLLGASGSAIVEFVIPEKGKFVMVDHEFADANAGAVGFIDASE